MHLNDSYDTIRGQILLMDPLPQINKAYSMIQQVENQRQVTNHSGTVKEVAANVSRLSGNQLELLGVANLSAKNNQGHKKDNRRLRNTRFCDHYQKNGHTKDQCFKLVGYPDWYEGPRGSVKARKSNGFAANVQGTTSIPGLDTPLEEAGVSDSGVLNMTDPSLIQALAKEMMKIMKGKQATESHTSHMSAYAQFAGTVPMSSQSIACSAVHNDLNSWIIDTGQL